MESTGITHHTAELNGIKQHWVSAGQGPPVYLLHGFPETWYGRRKQIPSPAERFTVIAPDLRGYGDTDKPAFAQGREDADRLIDCPVLTMWGEDFSAVGQADDVLEIRRGMARAVRGVAIRRCGHLCHEERPDVVNAELLAFLADWAG